MTAENIKTGSSITIKGCRAKAAFPINVSTVTATIICQTEKAIKIEAADMYDERLAIWVPKKGLEAGEECWHLRPWFVSQMSGDQVRFFEDCSIYDFQFKPGA